MSLYNPSKYEDRSKDIVDHVKTKRKKVSAIFIMAQKVLACSYDDRNVTSNRETFILILMKT